MCISDMRLPLEVKLEAKLARVPEWAAASPWHLRVTAESSGRKATEDYSSWRKQYRGKIRYVFCRIASYSCCQVPALEMCLQFLRCKGQQFSSHRNEVWLPGHGRISDDFRASQCDRHADVLTP